MKKTFVETTMWLVCRGTLTSAAFIAFVGCGGETASKQTRSTTSEDTSTSDPKQTSFDADVGALDQAKVNSTLNKASEKLTTCFTKGLERIPFMGGSIKFALRIGQGGVVNVAYLKESTLGDRTTEACMLDVLRAASWPSPVGGREGLAEGGLAFDPSPDERPAVDLPSDKLGKELPKAQKAIAECRSSAQAGPVLATMYVGTDGKPMAVGVATSDDKGEKAASCIVDALRAMTFASPGSYAGKVGISSD